jgi:arsenate reductase
VELLHKNIVCDTEHGERRPVFPGMTRRLSWSFPDPAIFTGSRAEKLTQVIGVREALRSKLEAWLASLPNSASTSP